MSLVYWQILRFTATLVYAFTHNELAGNGWLCTLHPNDIEKTIRGWTLAVETGGRYDLEYRVKRHDDVYRWFLARGTAMKDESGRIIKWYGTTTDIHDQKKAEEDILQGGVWGRWLLKQTVSPRRKRALRRHPFFFSFRTRWLQAGLGCFWLPFLITYWASKK